MKQLLPHVFIGTTSSGHMAVHVEDSDFFTFIEDYLLEQCGLGQARIRSDKIEGINVITMEFGARVTKRQLEEHLLKFDAAEIERLYQVYNNAASPGSPGESGT